MMKKTKVCFFVHSSVLGGAERSLLDLMRIVSDRGIECSIVMQGKGSLYETCRREGFVVKSVPSMAWWCYSHKNLAYTIEHDLRTIVDIVRGISPDIIYTQTIVNPFGAMVAEILQLPHIWALREYGEKDHKLPFEFGYRESMQAMFETSDAVFSVSKSVAEVVLQDESCNKKIHINYSYVDIPKEYKNVKILPISKSREVKIGIFGSVARGKNQKDVIEATIKLLEQGYNVSLTIVGQREENYYRELCDYLENQTYRDRISFEDFTDEPLAIMKDMDIVVSCAESEAMGRTLFEAIQLKKAIVYANSGGFKEVFEDAKHGLGYSVHNSDELMQKLQETIENPDETIERIENAYKYVNENFTPDTYSKELLEMIDELTRTGTNRKRSYVSEFLYQNLFEKYQNNTEELQDTLLEREREIQEKEQQIQEKELQIQNLHKTISQLEELAESMRIKNRIKNILPFFLKNRDNS